MCQDYNIRHPNPSFSYTDIQTVCSLVLPRKKKKKFEKTAAFFSVSRCE